MIKRLLLPFKILLGILLFIIGCLYCIPIVILIDYPVYIVTGKFKSYCTYLQDKSMELF